MNRENYTHIAIFDIVLLSNYGSNDKLNTEFYTSKQIKHLTGVEKVKCSVKHGSVLFRSLKKTLFNSRQYCCTTFKMKCF